MGTQVLNHNTPAAPTLTGGMVLGASGVTHPAVHAIGDMTALSSADGSFSDLLGKGQLDYDSLGRLFVADTNNNRVQCFVQNSSMQWEYNSKCSTLSALGSSVVVELVAIDRARNQIHIASSAQIAAGTWVGVWNLSDWPGLTTGNRVRSYGTSSGSNGAGNVRAGLCLTLVGDFAYVCSSAGDFRILKYNHTTGSIVVQKTNSLWTGNFVSDGTKLYAGAQASNTELGLWQFNDATLVGSARLDSASPPGVNYTRRNYLVQGVGGDVTSFGYYNGRVYVRLLRDGRIMAWRVSDNAFVDEFMWPGGASSSVVYGHAPGSMNSPQIQQAKFSFTVHPDTSRADWCVLWSGNAQNAANHSFLTMVPTSVATAEWSVSSWSSGVNTLTGIAMDGVDLSAEKFKVEFKKNSGSWVPVVAGQLFGSAFTTAISSLGTFTDGDTLHVRLSTSTWDRLDGGTLIATRDKLNPKNVRAILSFTDTEEGIFVPVQTAQVKVKTGPTVVGALKVKVSQ